MRLPRACAVLAAIVIAPVPASADDPPTGDDPDPAVAPDPAVLQPAPAPAPAPRPPRVGTDHRGQFGVSARVAVGLRAIATYDKFDFCGDRSPDTDSGFASVCIGRAPVSLDFELSYGFARKREVIMELRVGLERDFGPIPGTDGPRVHFVAPGVRFFFNEARTSKLFTQAQLVIDFSSYQDSAGQGRGTDFGFRNLNGLWFDLHHAYGFYVFVGETLTFKRWLMGDLEAGIGIQGRYP
jgi:hypothetical protein